MNPTFQLLSLKEGEAVCWAWIIKDNSLPLFFFFCFPFCIPILQTLQHLSFLQSYKSFFLRANNLTSVSSPSFTFMPTADADQMWGKLQLGTSELPPPSSFNNKLGIPPDTNTKFKVPFDHWGCCWFFFSLSENLQIQHCANFVNFWSDQWCHETQHDGARNRDIKNHYLFEIATEVANRGM